MYAVPDGYEDIMAQTDRAITVQMQIGFGMDPTAADDVTSITGGMLPLSNPVQILDSNYVMTPGLATFEGDGIPSAVSAGMLVPPLASQDYPPEAGVWSDVISDADGAMDWSLTIQLSAVHTSAFSVHTSEVHILQGRIQYYEGETLARDVTIDSTSEVFSDTTTATFDRIVLTVLRVTQPYHHVRIVEVEFGASITLSNDALGERVTLIQEVDRMGISAPIHQLDFSLLNVYGEYDADNPATRLGGLALWTPLDLSFTTITDMGQVTVPMGTYYITARESDETLLSITAQDPRAVLQSVNRPLELSTALSLGDTMEALLTDLRIPYVIDDTLYSQYPSQDVSLGDYNLLEQTVFIEQLYGIALRPGRDGYLHAYASAPTGTGPTLTPDVLLAYPSLDPGITYNGVSVSYGSDLSETFVVDLRTMDSEARNFLALMNPMIVTLEQAQAVASSVAAKVRRTLYECRAIADPAIDPEDIVPIAGRWTASSPREFTVTRLEYVFEGSFTVTIQGTV